MTTLLHIMLCVTIAYPVFISIIAIAVTVRDKRSAVRNRRRIKERTLFFIAIIGGAVAMFITMLIIRHKTKHKRFMLGLPIIIASQIIILTVTFNTSIQTTSQTIESDKITNPIRLLLVSDTHSCDYGKEQAELMQAIDKQKPDAVLLVGDIFDDNMTQANSEEFVEIISKKYSCYYVSGNHEFWSKRADDFKEIVERDGIPVLEGDTHTLEINGEKIAISGVDDPDTDRYPSRSIPYKKQIEQLSKSMDDSVFNVLLSHRPERMDDFSSLNADIVLSGHAHGGQWRIPFILQNGMFAPDQGWFPKYGNGMHSFGGTKLIVSRGLARETTRVPRIFNRPEMVVIEVK
jgi:Predicted phosphohydrolases